MTRLYSRSDWLGKGHTAPTIKRAQTEIYIHYPGASGTIGRESHAATVSRLRGYHRMHTVTNGWSDIAYNYAVSQNGDVYSLRGRDRQCGGNGGTTTNRRGQAILVLVGNNEQPTQDAIEGVRWAIAHIQEKHPGAKKILGHRDSFEASTACPGNILHGMVRKGVFYGSKKGGGKAPAVPSGGASKPAPKPAAKPKPSGKIAEDGRLGTVTVKALQKRLGVTQDGRAGEDTWRALQKLLGTVVDGAVSHQSYRATELGNGVVPRAWRFTGRGSKGSKMVVALQKRVGVKADGIWYQSTTSALQRALNSGKF